MTLGTQEVLGAPLEWSAQMTVTLITEDVEVPDFLSFNCVAIPYEALFPQSMDPIPGTQCMGAQMASLSALHGSSTLSLS